MSGARPGLIGLAILALAPGCGEVPAACDTMCAAAAELYGACLAADGLDWTAAGYADADDFGDACDTWAWELRRVEGDTRAAGALEATCVDREAVLTAPGADCDTYASLDWRNVPWLE